METEITKIDYKINIKWKIIYIKIIFEWNKGIKWSFSFEMIKKEMDWFENTDEFYLWAVKDFIKKWDISIDINSDTSWILKIVQDSIGEKDMVLVIDNIDTVRMKLKGASIIIFDKVIEQYIKEMKKIWSMLIITSETPEKLKIWNFLYKSAKDSENTHLFYTKNYWKDMISLIWKELVNVVNNEDFRKEHAFIIHSFPYVMEKLHYPKCSK